MLLTVKKLRLDKHCLVLLKLFTVFVSEIKDFAFVITTRPLHPPTQIKALVCMNPRYDVCVHICKQTHRSPVISWKLLMSSGSFQLLSDFQLTSTSAWTPLRPLSVPVDLLTHPWQIELWVLWWNLLLLLQNEVYLEWLLQNEVRKVMADHVSLGWKMSERPTGSKIICVSSLLLDSLTSVFLFRASSYWNVHIYLFCHSSRFLRPSRSVSVQASLYAWLPEITSTPHVLLLPSVASCCLGRISCVWRGRSSTSRSEMTKERWDQDKQCYCLDNAPMRKQGNTSPLMPSYCWSFLKTKLPSEVMLKVSFQSRGLYFVSI